MEVPKLWGCSSCGSSNFKINPDSAALVCAYCEESQDRYWQIRQIDQQAQINCQCGSPIFSIAHPGILFCPNCKKDASSFWQLISAQKTSQSIKINPIQ